jgi:hypothetical protein
MLPDFHDQAQPLISVRPSQKVASRSSKRCIADELAEFAAEFAPHAEPDRRATCLRWQQPVPQRNFASSRRGQAAAASTPERPVSGGFGPRSRWH